MWPGRLAPFERRQFAPPNTTPCRLLGLCSTRRSTMLHSRRMCARMCASIYSKSTSCAFPVSAHGGPAARTEKANGRTSRLQAMCGRAVCGTVCSLLRRPLEDEACPVERVLTHFNQSLRKVCSTKSNL